MNIVEMPTEKVVCFSPDIRIWSGRQKLQAVDLQFKNVMGVELPPEMLASLGSKKICDPEKLKPFFKIKRKVESLIQANAIVFRRGINAVPATKARTLYAAIDALGVQFEQARVDFLKSFDKTVEDWKATNADWAGILNAAPPRDAVEKKLSFAVNVFRLAPATDDPDDDLNREVMSAASGMRAQLMAEVSGEFSKMLARDLGMKDKTTRKTLNPVKRMRDKIDGFTFLDPALKSLVVMIDKVLASMPSEGPIEGPPLASLFMLVSLMSNADRALAAAAEAYQGDVDALAQSLFFQAAIAEEGPSIAVVEVEPTVAPTSTTSQSPVMPVADDAFPVLPLFDETAHSGSFF
jgi:hypothetical protein